MDESNIIPIRLPHGTLAPLDPDKVLSKAIEAGLSEVIVLGYVKDEHGDQVEYFAGTTSDPATLLLLVERFKRDVIFP